MTFVLASKMLNEVYRENMVCVKKEAIKTISRPLCTVLNLTLVICNFSVTLVVSDLKIP